MYQRFFCGPLVRAASFACAFLMSSLAFGVTTSSTSPGPLVNQPGNAYYYQSAPGSQPCSARGGTLASYEALNYTGCTVGKITFYNFSAYSPTNGNFNASQILITPGTGATGPFLGFNSSLFNLLTGTQTYVIEYNIDPPIDILGYGLSDDPFSGATNVMANICENSYLPNCIKQPPNTGCYDYYDCEDPVLNLNATNQSVFTTFDPGTQFLDVQLTITIDATKGPASIPHFNAIVTPAPEPEEWALAGIGGLALLGTTVGSRRRRTKAARPAA